MRLVLNGEHSFVPMPRNIPKIIYTPAWFIHTYAPDIEYFAEKYYPFLHDMMSEIIHSFILWLHLPTYKALPKLQVPNVHNGTQGKNDRRSLHLLAHTCMPCSMERIFFFYPRHVKANSEFIGLQKIDTNYA